MFLLSFKSIGLFHFISILPIIFFITFLLGLFFLNYLINSFSLLSSILLTILVLVIQLLESILSIIVNLEDICLSLSRTHTTIHSGTETMKSSNLKFTKFDIESFDKLFKHVLAFTHQLLSLFLSKSTEFTHFWDFKIRENDHKDFP